MDKSRMDRIDRIMDNQVFRACMDIINRAEVNRVYCLHDIEHSLDVARIGHILNLEEGLRIKRDVVYAAALLHDIGRSQEYELQISHHQAGAGLARDILRQSGYDEQEISDICLAIERHRNPIAEEDRRDLCYLLYRADKLSRNCFACAAYQTCYWQEDRKNKKIVL